MCGRFSLQTDFNVLQELFEFELIEDEEVNPRYNIAPGQQILAIVQDGNRRVGRFFKWGLVPFFAKDPKIGYRMINARSETIDEKASFKHAFKNRRALIVADGFYEWKKEGKKKKPYRFILRDGKPFVMAGLWEKASIENEPLLTCTILTGKPNGLVKDIHDRMPVIANDFSNEWLDTSLTDTNYLKSLFLPYPEAQMEKYEVSSLVNSPKNDDSSLIAPLNSK